MDYAPLNQNVKVKIVQPTLLMRMFRKAFLTSKGWNYNLKEMLMRVMPNCDVNVAGHSLLALPTLLSGKGKPIHLVQAYEPQTQYYRDSYLARESEFSYGLPMKILCVSPHLAKMVNGVDIGNGLDLGLYKQLPIQKLEGSVLGINTRPNIPWKNGVLLEQVFAALRCRGIPTLSPLRGIRDTMFVRYYNMASIYLFLSWVGFEGFGLQPLEAMACGVPVVTSPSISYAYHLKNAYVLPPNFSVYDVLNAIDELNSNSELRGRLVKNGLATARNYDFKNVINNFLKEVAQP
jgi:glycosyltransferase involved in cell wall biosynthesis